MSDQMVLSDTGSPAHAGIDPYIDRDIYGERRFPRTRGDRPTSDSLTITWTMVPPHTRG